MAPLKANNPQQNLDLLNKVTQQESELRELRAQVEQLQNENEQLKQRNRDQYVDLDSRLQRLEGGAPAAATPNSAATPPAPAEPAPAPAAAQSATAESAPDASAPADPAAEEAETRIKATGFFRALEGRGKKVIEEKPAPVGEGIKMRDSPSNCSSRPPEKKKVTCGYFSVSAMRTCVLC